MRFLARQVMLRRPSGYFSPMREPELGQDVAHVNRGGLGRDEERAGDIRIRPSGGDESRHLELTPGESARRLARGTPGPPSDRKAGATENRFGLAEFVRSAQVAEGSVGFVENSLRFDPVHRSVT